MRNDEAVSPVIGVILMVAITVILAAVIAAFIFGMAGQVSKTKIVAATVQKPTSGEISVTYQGGPDAFVLNNIAVTINGEVQATAIENSDGSTPLAVGASASYTGYAAPATGTRDHVVGIGHFSDNSEQVVFDNYI